MRGGRKANGRSRVNVAALAVLLLLLPLAARAGTNAPPAELAANLDELGLAPVELRVLKRTPLAASPNLTMAQDYLPKGQKVRLLVYRPDRYYVEGRVATGPARGWVAAAVIESPSAPVVAEIQRRALERVQHWERIEHHEVAPGMTPAEVEASLGRPERVVRGHTKDGDEERWLYATYSYVPQYHSDSDAGGQLHQSVSYMRLETGHQVVVFQGREVVRVEGVGTNPELPGGPTR